MRPAGKRAVGSGGRGGSGQRRGISYTLQLRAELRGTRVINAGANRQDQRNDHQPKQQGDCAVALASEAGDESRYCAAEDHGGSLLQLAVIDGGVGAWARIAVLGQGVGRR